MPPKKRLKAKNLVNDIRGGVDDSLLMVKYGLSSKGLQSVFRKLVTGNFIRKNELENRSELVEDTAEIDIHNKRQGKRFFPALRVPVTAYDRMNSAQEGTIVDIAENGLGVRGIETDVAETKTFVIQVGALSEFDPFEFRAQCRWVKRESFSGGALAGFEITDISKEGMRELRDLIERFSLSTETQSCYAPEGQIYGSALRLERGKVQE